MENYCEICNRELVWVSTKGMGNREGYYLCLKCDKRFLSGDLK